MYDIWTEKYRPATLDEVVGQNEITKRLKAYVRNKSLPHMLFAGPAGTGKTTCAIALSHEIFGDFWQQNFIELNASDERGIQVVRTKIKEFARSAPLGGSEFKIIFLDEADALTADAQAALRRTMEKYTGICRFILSCNYSSKIIEPIQSRCAVFRFSNLHPEDITQRLMHIAEEEGIELTSGGIESILYVCGGDMRKAVNTLQVASAVSNVIDEDTVYMAVSTAKPEEVKNIIMSAASGDFMGARKNLETIMTKQGVSGTDIVKQMFKVITDEPMDDNMRIKLIQNLGETDFRITEGANEIIQLQAFLAYISYLGKNLEENNKSE